MSSVTWAAGSSVYSKAAKDSTPFAVNLTRACIALACFLIAHFAFSSSIEAAFSAFANIRPESIGWMGLSILSCYVVGDVLFIKSTHFLGVPGGLAIASSYPIWTALGGWAFDRQSLGLAKWFGLLLSIFGIVMVILNSPEVDTGRSKKTGRSPQQTRAIGVLLALGASLCWASNTYSVAKGSQGISIEIGNTLRMAFGILMIPIMSHFFAKGEPLILSWKKLKPYYPVFVFESFGGSYFFVVGLQKSPLVVASTLASLAPVLAVPIEWIMRTEKFSLARTFGVFCVVLGLAMLMGALSFLS